MSAALLLPSQAQLVALGRDGFVVVPRFFDLAVVGELLRWTEELYAAPERPGRHWLYREDSIAEPGRRLVQRIENFCPFHEGFDRVVRDGALVRWAAALMGGPVVLFKEKINFKLPGSPGFKAHQDQQAGWSRYAPRFLTAMVTLDAATIENGCLEVAAGAPPGGLIGAEWEPLAEAGLDLRPVPTGPGDVIFFDSFVPHASGPNRTTEPRRILYLTYNLSVYGDQRVRYYADKHTSFPPDIERDRNRQYVFRV